MPAVELIGISKSYREHIIVDNVSFKINEGDFFCLLGTSGSGKSTVLNILMDFTRPDSGTAEVFGYDCNRESSEAKRNIAYVPAEPVYTGSLKVKTIINDTLNAYNVHMDPIKATILDYFEIDTDRRIRTMPLNMKKRLALAMAFIVQTPLMVLDEPYHGLDKKAVNILTGLLKESHSSGTTVLITEHSIDVAKQLATRTALINNGAILDIDEKGILTASGARLVSVKTNDDISAMLNFFGVKTATRNGDYISFLFKHDINSLVRALTQYNIDDLQISLPSLKDAITRLYEKRAEVEDRLA